MKKVLIPLPKNDFDPTEVTVPWKILSEGGAEITFITPDGKPAQCDPIILTGKGLKFFAPFLKATGAVRRDYARLEKSREFLNPKTWDSVKANDFDAIVLPGGHAQGMREYLESPILQKLVSEFFAQHKLVGAICHGVILAARSHTKAGKSVLWSRKTTSLLASQELLAWALTFLWLGSYYRTYPQTVESEVRSTLLHQNDFLPGPLPIFRDSPTKTGRGFVVVDDNYISARWPGDAHEFSTTLLHKLG